jgi:hypothetical protein
MSEPPAVAGGLTLEKDQLPATAGGSVLSVAMSPASNAPRVGTSSTTMSVRGVRAIARDAQAIEYRHAQSSNEALSDAPPTLVSPKSKSNSPASFLACA